jgi:SAM-dependent methyltransferase
MVAAKSVEVAIDLPELFQRNLTFPEVRLEQATVFLEASGDGRKSWLLDLEQQDENARIRIGRVALDRAMLGFDDVARKTSLRATLSTGADGAENSATSDLMFTATGQFKGLAVKAQGSGGPVLEVGCGTGRVLIPTARAGINIFGIDLSPYMLDVCERRLEQEPIEVQNRVQIDQADMRDFDLGQTFSLITIPFRPFQHLIEVEDQIACLRCVHRHLETISKIRNRVTIAVGTKHGGTYGNTQAPSGDLVGSSR